MVQVICYINFLHLNNLRTPIDENVLINEFLLSKKVKPSFGLFEFFEDFDSFSSEIDFLELN